MALGTRGRHLAVLIPVPERFFRSGKVTIVDPAQALHEGCVQVFDRVIQELDDVLATVGISAGVFQRRLIVVRCFGQPSGPGVVPVAVVGLVIIGLTAISPGFAAITKIKGIKIAATIIFATAFVNLGLLVDFKTFKVQPIIVSFLAWVSALVVFLLMV